LFRVQAEDGIRCRNVTGVQTCALPISNGGQLSACNAEVWNNTSTIFKGLKWMLRRDAPLLMNPAPSWHKYSWMAEFIRHIPNYRSEERRVGKEGRPCVAVTT